MSDAWRLRLLVASLELALASFLVAWAYFHNPAVRPTRPGLRLDEGPPIRVERTPYAVRVAAVYATVGLASLAGACLLWWSG